MSATIRVLRDPRRPPRTASAAVTDPVLADADVSRRDATISRGGGSQPRRAAFRGLPAPAPELPPCVPRGLPGPLPAGERLLWQGAPGWREAALGIVHLRKLCGYFMLLAFLCTLRALAGGSDHPWLSLVALLVCAALSLSLLALFALLVSRTSVYTITDRRVVLRIGVAWGMSINLPFAMIESANLRLKRDGSGDIALLLSGPNRMGIVTLWPHVRPWHARRVQPMLRALPNARQVAALLSQALADSLARDAEAALSTDAGILAEDTGVPAAGDGHPIVPADPSYQQPARPADLLGTPLGLVLTSVGTGKAS